MVRKKRVRHHVNPFAFTRETAPPDWRTVFARPEQPLEVDIGSANGEFLIARAAQAPGVNVVGLEIREPLVDVVRERIARAGLSNCAVALCHATRDLGAFFAPASVSRFFIHFPDPWFKARHKKRRLISPAFVELLASRLAPGGEVEVMTDDLDYATECFPLLDAGPAFQNVHGVGVTAPPTPEGRALSHREVWHLKRNDPIHRGVWRKK